MIKKKNTLIIILAIFFACLFALPITLKLINGKDKTSSINGVEIIECDIQWEQGESEINLIGGMIRTNIEVERIFVNVAGVGVQDLEFTESVVETANAKYVTYTLEKTDTICATSLEFDGYVEATVYVQHAGIYYKADTQDIKVKSCWIGRF